MACYFRLIFGATEYCCMNVVRDFDHFLYLIKNSFRARKAKMKISLQSLWKKRMVTNFKKTFNPIFHLANLFARTVKKVGTLSTCSRRIFSPVNFIQSRCRILVLASRRANKVAKWKIGFTWLYFYRTFATEFQSKANH